MPYCVLLEPIESFPVSRAASDCAVAISNRSCSHYFGSFHTVLDYCMHSHYFVQNACESVSVDDFVPVCTVAPPVLSTYQFFIYIIISYT